MAVTIDDDAVNFVRAERSDSGVMRLAAAGIVEFEGPGARERAGRSLALDRWPCLTVLRPQDYQLTLVDAPTVPAAELKKAIRWQVKDMLDYHVDDATIDILDVPGEPSGNSRHYMYAVSARNETIQQIQEKFAGARIPLSVIDIPETALRNVASLFDDELRGVALLYFAADWGLLTISLKGELYYSRRIDLGMNQLRNAGGAARHDLFGKIVLELQRTFDHVDRQYRFVSMGKLVLGPEPEDTGLREHLAGNFDLEIVEAGLGDVLRIEQPIDRETTWKLFPLIGAALRQEPRVL
jgi:MSHA biogenesis protein MshI